MVTGFEVDVERSLPVECFVRSDRVEDVPVLVGVPAELEAVVDLVPVEVLVLQGAEGALSDAVLLRRPPPGADVDQLLALAMKAAKRAALNAGQLSETSAIGRTAPQSPSSTLSTSTSILS